MAAKRPASKIVWTAVGLGAGIIFVSTMVRELGWARADRACAAGDLAQCSRRCARGGESACAELERRCAAEDRRACQTLTDAKGARRERNRW
jgi:hypothetical protein